MSLDAALEVKISSSVQMMFNSSDFGTFQLSFISENTYTQKSKAVEIDLVSPAALKHVCLLKKNVFLFLLRKKAHSWFHSKLQPWELMGGGSMHTVHCRSWRWALSSLILALKREKPPTAEVLQAPFPLDGDSCSHKLCWNPWSLNWVEGFLFFTLCKQATCRARTAYSFFTQLQ